MTTNGEDIDAIAFVGNSLTISTVGTINANGVSNGRDEDLFVFTGTTGSNTSGSFSRYFDGSDVGLTAGSEDVDAATFTSGGNLLFSTVNDFSVTGLSGSDEDVVEFTGSYGNTTAGSFAMRLDLTTLGISSNEDIGSLHIIN